MIKQDILQQLAEHLKAEIQRLQAANKQAAAGATDSESRAESKWDTQGLESSYLARGYAAQFDSMNEQAKLLNEFSPASFTGQPIDTGALVKCDFDGYRSWVFLLPCCGGTELMVEDEEVTVVTPESPLAGALVGRQAGDAYQLPNGAMGTILIVE
ncbi:MAG: transcription elongation factor GreAB [Puniceicoccaceae bacterium]